MLKQIDNRDMKASDLRIGNLVKYHDDGDKVWYDVEFNIGHFSGIMDKNYGLPDPIELTEEWLLKFGFTKELVEYRKGNFTIKNDFTVNSMGHWRLIIKSVHQLQNLYHSLTGKELTINH
tara:strand:+ start:2859 stop:3218 length:360 start_codon:yes stop_codon:yes gene_type:complete